MTTMTTLHRHLPPLHHKRTRVQLLANSYLDACDSTAARHNHDHHSKPEHGGRTPGRNSELWAHGSYRALERTIDQLRRDKPRTAIDFWQTYIRHTTIHNEYRQQRARQGLTYVTVHMPATVHVPAAIALAAGYVYADAIAYDRDHTTLDDIDFDPIPKRAA